MTVERTSRGRSEDGRRAELVEAAMRLLAREGIAAATTRRIAEEAGVPQGLVHYWFAGKDELLAEVIQTELRALQDSGATAPHDDSQPAADLLSRFRAAFSVVEAEEPGRQLALYELTTWALRKPKRRELARQQYTAYRELAAAEAAAWTAHRDLELPGDADALAQFTAALFDGLTLAWLADPEGTKPDAVFALVSELLTHYRP